MGDIAATPHKGVQGHMDLAKARRHSIQHQRQGVSQCIVHTAMCW